MVLGTNPDLQHHYKLCLTYAGNVILSSFVLFLNENIFDAFFNLES